MRKSNLISMLSNNSLKQIVNNLHRHLVKSANEFKKDNRGGFLIPTSSKITDSDYNRYRHLPPNWDIPPITKDDLPPQFSSQAVKTVDMFRRKTFDLPYECMIYFDYITGNIVSCNFSVEESPDEIKGVIYKSLLKKMHIASIHNHPIQYFSPPSGKNFEMLGLEFEEFEIISSQREIWILESRDIVLDDYTLFKLREKFDNSLKSVFDEMRKDFDKDYLILDNVNEGYGDFLLNYLNRKCDKIKLTRRYLNG